MKARVTITVELFKVASERPSYTIGTTHDSAVEGLNSRTASHMREALAEAVHDVETAVTTRYPEGDEAEERWWHKPPLQVPFKVDVNRWDR